MKVGHEFGRSLDGLLRGAFTATWPYPGAHRAALVGWSDGRRRWTRHTARTAPSSLRALSSRPHMRRKAEILKVGIASARGVSPGGNALAHKA